jgi:hypothetical protein
MGVYSMAIIPNGYIRFKTALGTETDIDVHVKISGVICIWIGQFIDGDGQPREYLPDQEAMKKMSWWKELVRKYGEYQGIFQRNSKIEIPGEEAKPNKLNW